MFRVNSAVERRFSGCDLRLFPTPEGVTRIQMLVLLSGASKDRRATESRLSERTTPTRLSFAQRTSLIYSEEGAVTRTCTYATTNARTPARHVGGRRSLKSAV